MTVTLLSIAGHTVREDLQAPVIVTAENVTLAPGVQIHPAPEVPGKKYPWYAALDVRAPGFRHGGGTVHGDRCLYSIRLRWSDPLGRIRQRDLAVLDHVFCRSGKHGIVGHYGLLEQVWVGDTAQDGFKLDVGSNLWWRGGGCLRIGATPAGTYDPNDPNSRPHADGIQIQGTRPGTRSTFERLQLLVPHPSSPGGDPDHASNGCVYMETQLTGIQDIEFIDCTMDGGTYTEWVLEQSHGLPRGIAFRDCLYGRNYALGLLNATEPRSIVHENPRWADTGELVTIE